MDKYRIVQEWLVVDADKDEYVAQHFESQAVAQRYIDSLQPPTVHLGQKIKVKFDDSYGSFEYTFMLIQVAPHKCSLLCMDDFFYGRAWTWKGMPMPGLLPDGIQVDAIKKSLTDGNHYTDITITLLDEDN